MVTYDLPRLPYGYGEMEPLADEFTMRVHHGSIHREYINGMHRALEEVGGQFHPAHISAILSDFASVPKHARQSVGFFGGGFENHRLFWNSITPGGTDPPGGGLADAMEVYFGGFGGFVDSFTKKALSVEGSGWCWLVFDPAYCRIEIAATTNNGSPWMYRKIPLMALDLWEHAYYAKYRHDRNRYIESWWKVVNWDYVQARFAEAG